MDKDLDKRFDIVFSANVTYTLTIKDLEFLNIGQSIQVMVDEKCGLILNPPQENKN